jgi:hypothetical protein
VLRRECIKGLAVKMKRRKESSRLCTGSLVRGGCGDNKDNTVKFTNQYFGENERTYMKER